MFPNESFRSNHFTTAKLTFSEMRPAVLLIVAIGAIAYGNPLDGHEDHPPLQFVGFLPLDEVEHDYSLEESRVTAPEVTELPALEVNTLDHDKASEANKDSEHQIYTLLQLLEAAKQRSEQKINALRMETEAAKKETDQKIKDFQQQIEAVKRETKELKAKAMAGTSDTRHPGKNDCKDAEPKVTMKQRIRKVEMEITTEYNSDNKDNDKSPEKSLQVLSQQVAGESCPTDFVSIKDGCYHFNSYDLKDWNKAQKKCKKLDSRSSLVTLESKEKWDSIRDYLIEHNLDKINWWIGGSDQAVEGSWKWEATHQPIEFSDWCLNEPNNNDGMEDCGMIAGVTERFNRDGRLCWNDFPCKWERDLALPVHFICEIKKD